MNEEPKNYEPVNNNDVEEVNGLAELLVRFAEQDKAKTTGSLPSGRLSMLQGERTTITIVGEDGEPVETVEVPLLDEE